ncbi:MAG: glycosyltransferase family 4 protein [Planctomycetes bacterium]|nr:glycosyltransferase family 4 protein [Planctomycetota bacterium]
MHRILYLSRGGNIGGSQRQLYHVLCNLDRKFYEPIVVCRKEGTSVEQLKGAQIATYMLPLHPWRSFPAGLFRYVDAMRLAKFALKHRISLIHSSDLWLNGYLTWTARRINVPSVLHVRTPLSTQCVHKHRCDDADSLIAISRRVRKDLLHAGIAREKIAVINDAVDTDLFSPKPSAANILNRQFPQTQGLRIGLVGRIEPFKHQFDFLRAAKCILGTHGRSATFFLIGKVHCQEYHQDVVDFIHANDMGDRVVLTGARDDIPQVLNSLDMLVSLSGGSVMFEAMSCAKPVLSAGFSTKENSVHIQDGKTGLLVTSKKTGDLIDAMLRLMDNADLRRYLGRQGRKWAKDNFSHVSMAIKTQSLYDKTIAQYDEQYCTRAAGSLQPIGAAAQTASAATSRY